MQAPVPSLEAGEFRLGIVGAGKFGTTLARAAIAAGYDVAISGSGPADDIALTVDVLAAGAHAATTDEVVRHADIIVLVVPTHRFRELPRDLFAGKPERFVPYVELYKRALQQYGQPELPIGLHSLGFVAETDDEALEIQWPYYKEQFDWAASERGWRPPTYEQFLAEVDHGSMYVGSPETVANRIAAAMQALSLSRFDLLYAVGRVPHDQRIATIELYGREVIPRVRELLAATPEAEDVAAAVRN